VLTIPAYGFAALSANHGHVLTIAADGLAAFAADARHVIAIAADHFTAFSSGGAGLLRRELMCRAFFVGSASAFGGDFTLSLRVHRSESPFTRARTGAIRHDMAPLKQLRQPTPLTQLSGEMVGNAHPVAVICGLALLSPVHIGLAPLGDNPTY
jgi:hypothetical protein